MRVKLRVWWTLISVEGRGYGYAVASEVNVRREVRRSIVVGLVMVDYGR